MNVTAAVANRTWFIYLAIGGAILFAASLLFTLINRHAVDIFFADQWDFLTPVFGNPSVWQMFTYQHGPHRQGIGLFVSQAIGMLTNWNTRTESFVIGFILFLTTFAALILKKRLFGKFTFWDLIIPFITLSFTQIETAVLTPNPAHGALPVLLIILCGICFTIENKAVSYFGAVASSFLATFTGFGFFIGLVMPIVLAILMLVHFVRQQRRKGLIATFAFLFSIMTLVLFFTNYAFSPAADCFQFPHSRPFEYLTFISIQLTSFVGFFQGYKAPFAKPFGILLLVILISIVFVQAWKFVRWRRFDSKQLVIFMFISYSLLFAVNCAVGRVCISINLGQSSRYMPLLVPGWLALYFAANEISKKSARIAALIILTILFAVLPVRRFSAYDKDMEFYSDAKRRWASCYLATENVQDCDQTAGHWLYPQPEATQLKMKLDLLKQKGFNLFAQNEKP